MQTDMKNGIYPATYYSWKKKFETMGEAGFRHGMTPAQLKEIKRLEKENDMLKKLWLYLRTMLS
jgi:putative transposase